MSRFIARAFIGLFLAALFLSMLGDVAVQL